MKYLKILMLGGVGALIAGPAAAANFLAFESFNGTNGNNGFSYGSTNFSMLTPFASGSTCADPLICLGFLPGVFRTTGGAFESGTVNVPADRVVLHPGPNADLSNSVYIAFTAPTAGNFIFTSQFTVQDDAPTGVSIFAFFASGTTVTFSSLVGTLPGPVVNDTFGAALLAGESFGYIISNNGLFNNDSTGVLASVAGPATPGIPEPATWALMIGGFGLVGAAARRQHAKIVAA